MRVGCERSAKKESAPETNEVSFGVLESVWLGLQSEFFKNVNEKILHVVSALMRECSHCFLTGGQVFSSYVVWGKEELGFSPLLFMVLFTHTVLLGAIFQASAY